MARSIVIEMAVRIGSALSTQGDTRVGATEAAMAARAPLAGAPVDLAVVFASGAHLAAPEATLEGVHEALAPRELIGCGAGGILGGRREIEGGTAVAVWAASFQDEGAVSTFRAEANESDDGIEIEGLPDLDGARAAILLPDSYSFPTDRVLRELNTRARGVPVLGGISSARTFDGAGALFHGEELVDGGAVGARIEGIDVLPCVSQGAAPVGPELTITAAEGHVIQELAGAPALTKLRDVVGELPSQDRELVAQGLLVGIVTDPGKPSYERGDFLVRGLLGADPDAGAIAVGASVTPGQVLRLHARDAASADEDLRAALDLRMRALGGATPAGALVFTCNGRGQEMFGIPDHDASTLSEVLSGAPAAGFFAAGEIGPVGGESYLHGFTATVAIFPP
jgi:small ligand-binding sensory domain FIST